jgi:glycosyltransferase involved in cell wall biosynthesis
MDSTDGRAPFLSVVVPTYNRRDSLRSCLDGLARQTFDPARFEVVVVSDGATDGSEAMVAGIAPLLPFRLNLVRQVNGGPSKARNRGVREARGEVVILLDDDMEPLPEFLAEHAARHEHCEDLVVIGPMLPDPARCAAEPVWIAWEHAMLGRQYRAWETGEWGGAGPNHFYSGNASLRREHILAVGGFDESFTRQEDVELAFRMQRARGVRFAFHAAAAGLHRPDRTFEAWERVPYAYGRLDVERARRGDGEAWRVVSDGYRRRNALTRGVARLALTSPRASALIRARLRAAAERTYARRPDPSRADGRHAQAAFALLSALYNTRYVEGARAALDADPATRAVPVWAHRPPFPAVAEGGAAA